MDLEVLMLLVSGLQTFVTCSVLIYSNPMKMMHHMPNLIAGKWIYTALCRSLLLFFMISARPGQAMFFLLFYLSHMCESLRNNCLLQIPCLPPFFRRCKRVRRSRVTPHLRFKFVMLTIHIFVVLIS